MNGKREMRGGEGSRSMGKRAFVCRCLFVTAKLNRASTEQDYKHFFIGNTILPLLVRLSGNKANDGEN